MSTVVLDAATREKLLAAGGEVVFLDESGHVLGVYKKAPNLDDLKKLVVDGEWPTDDELDRIERAGGPTYTTAQVLTYLRGLSK